MASILPPPESLEADQPQLLYEGQRLSQPEFHRLYEQVPPRQRFELIDGVVFMAAAERRPHNRLATLLSGVFMRYESATPGVDGLAGATTILDGDNEPEPDLQLRIHARCGGQTQVNSDGYVAGSPELVVEVSHSTLNRDLREKLPVYQRLGVHEYWVICVAAAEIRWFVWPNGERQMDSDGILKCESFPGLWIDVRALFEERLQDLNATLERGVSTPEHAAFVSLLQSRQKKG